MQTSNGLLALWLLLPLALSSCGSSDPKEEGYDAMQSGDYALAVAKFDEALGKMDASAQDYAEVKVASCQALAHEDPERAKTDFLAFAQSAGDKVTPSDFSMVVTDLVSSAHFDPAITILDVGMKQFPEAPKMKQLLDKVVKKSQEAGDSDALERLKGLGYL